MGGNTLFYLTSFTFGTSSPHGLITFTAILPFSGVERTAHGRVDDGDFPDHSIA
jgi:hypothetical protein